MSTPSSPLAPAKPSRGRSLGCVIPFGLIFAAIGCVAFYFVTLRPMLDASASANWTKVPCEILSSEVERKSDSDGSTYRVAVRYRYTWSGRTHESDRYDFTTGSTNIGVKKMRAAVASLPPGRQTVCYVDPAAPDNAVLTRETGSGVWFGALALLFPLFGFGLIFSAWRSGRAKSSPLARASGLSPFNKRTEKFNRLDSPERTVPGEVALKPASGRVAAFIGLTFFTLIWNGILSVIAYNVLHDFSGGPDWFFALFLIPFVGVGLLMLVLALQAFSRLFAPPVEVRLDPSRLSLGARVPFTWRLGGSGVRKLTIRLIGREEATYRQGTRTATDKSDFHRSVLIETTDAFSLAEGQAELVLPAEAAAPTFTENKNRIIWELAFEGTIPWRADVDDRFPLPVRGPSQPPGLAATPEPQPRSGGGLTLWTVDRFAPGETLVFTLSRDTQAKTGPLTVQLGWFTEGKGTRDAAIEWSDYLPGLAPGTDHNFEVRLPETPWSFAGKLVAVEWLLEVLDSDRKQLIAVPLVIAPWGQTVNLPALPKESSFSKWKSRFTPPVVR
ncbi:MAG: hypothetical protein RIQ79_2653 [Verrucomicrobiota bacterium]